MSYNLCHCVTWLYIALAMGIIEVTVKNIFSIFAPNYLTANHWNFTPKRILWLLTGIAKSNSSEKP